MGSITASQKRLKEIFYYNTDTGHLYYRDKSPSDFSNPSKYAPWAARFKNKMAGWVREGQYVRVAVDGEQHRAHRVIFKMVHGQEPEAVDHINGVKTDNRIENLRAANKKINAKNAKTYSTNTSGFRGVRFNDSFRKWGASITVDQRRINLGWYGNFDEAVEARLKAERRFNFHPNHGRIVEDIA